MFYFEELFVSLQILKKTNEYTLMETLGQDYNCKTCVADFTQAWPIEKARGFIIYLWAVVYMQLCQPTLGYLEESEILFDLILLYAYLYKRVYKILYLIRLS